MKMQPAGVAPVILLSGVVLTSALLGSSITNRSVTTASGSSSVSSEAASWEYCAILRLKRMTQERKTNAGPEQKVVEVCFFTEEGCRQSEIAGNSREDSYARAIAILGREGWEMTGSIPFPGFSENIDVIAFRRAKVKRQ